jgi:hypothetical protein
MNGLEGENLGNWDGRGFEKKILGVLDKEIN